MRVNGPSSASIGHAAQGDGQPAPVSDVPTHGALALQPASHMKQQFETAPEHLPLPLALAEEWADSKAWIGRMERHLESVLGGDLNAVSEYDLMSIVIKALDTICELDSFSQFENTSDERKLDLLGRAIDICLKVEATTGLTLPYGDIVMARIAMRAHALYTERAMGVQVRIRKSGGNYARPIGLPDPAHKVDLLAYCRARQAAGLAGSKVIYNDRCSLHQIYDDDARLSQIPIPDVDARALSRYEFELLTSGSTPAYWTTQSSSAEETQLRWKFTDAAVKAALAYKARLAHQLEADMPRGDPTLGVDDRTTVAKLVAEYTQQSNRLTG